MWFKLQVLLSKMYNTLPDMQLWQHSDQLYIYIVREAVLLNKKLRYVNEHQKCLLQECR